ncbi:O-linked N-acetylglucosamine transferase, SPINDLY family protein [Calothrix membranacea FACHB-236]|nr:O-linked N-acetylglucosamine transferase, SPINDLY family protein [Calothrix membranacea FACHB-236]
MTILPDLEIIDNHEWQKQAEQYLREKKYDAASTLYERAIEINPDINTYYWYLGLILLLKGQEQEAHLTWSMAMFNEEDTTESTYYLELLEILNTQIQICIQEEDYQTAWLISQHIKELAPDDINNLLQIILFNIHLADNYEQNLEILDIINNHLSSKLAESHIEILASVIKEVLVNLTKEQSVIPFIQNCLNNIPDDSIETIIDIIMVQSVRIAYALRSAEIAATLAKSCLDRVPENLYTVKREILFQLSHFYCTTTEFDKSIEVSKLSYVLVSTLLEKIFANFITINGLMTAGVYFEESDAALKYQLSILNKFIEEKPEIPDQAACRRLIQSAFFFPYLYDNPHKNRHIQNYLANSCQDYILQNNLELAAGYQKKLDYRKAKARVKPKKHINIGYISACLKQHSVGWLSRWLFKYHDQDKFKIYAYSLGDALEKNYFVEQFFVKHTEKFYQFDSIQYGYDKIREQIQADEIDILIDLDSITYDQTCIVMSVRSAPIQATWLGWDASGIPAIDYYIADNYVLPESAQDYYSEKIWRLPTTYIAVDGFESGIPNIKRSDLDIPDDAIIYFVSQRGFKLNREIIASQLKIIKKVPNSYLLIKSESREKSFQECFNSIAEEEGVSLSQIKFFPRTPTELIHRANLGIVDVVLDTYPYNGATTTLETLWMGTPLVTRVGEQFSARNSYTMMINAGITEGIAWSEEEYIDWGVRLGKDEKLRQQISWKLRQSRNTAPLWNAKQFTRDMEKAYEQMWQKYLDS